MSPLRLLRALLDQWHRRPLRPGNRAQARVAGLRQLREPLAVISTAHLNDSSFA